MHCVASFEVKNNGTINVFIAQADPPIEVLIPPGKTSPAFSSPGTYIIKAELEKLPLPPPEIIITFSPGQTFEVKAVNKPNLNVEIFANLKFDFSKGDLVSSLSRV